ncbi:hypothetical protein [Telmatospirillum sp. J64-1]|uniref:hypothetical protein n=1 Tax=Telmatospirillum sp. J64-1 TaxID=2502183 RepID=UPI00115E70A9|nr:hypothetical protein [Telmatospirillum sp. J64-1]
MEEKMTARLPNLDIELVRRDFPEEQAEVVTIRLKATPDLRSVAGFLAPQAMMMPFLAANPFLQMAQAAWAPWLKMMGAEMTALPGPEREKPGTEQ